MMQRYLSQPTATMPMEDMNSGRTFPAAKQRQSKVVLAPKGHCSNSSSHRVIGIEKRQRKRSEEALGQCYYSLFFFVNEAPGKEASAFVSGNNFQPIWFLHFLALEERFDKAWQ
jgi:hypothetical protein